MKNIIAGICLIAMFYGAAFVLAGAFVSESEARQQRVENLLEEVAR